MITNSFFFLNHNDLINEPTYKYWDLRSSFLGLKENNFVKKSVPLSFIAINRMWYVVYMCHTYIMTLIIDENG